MNISDLADYLELDNNSSKSDEIILSEVNDKNILVLDTTLYTTKHFVKIFGLETARIMIGGFQAAAKLDPLLDQMYLSLANVGLNFADDDVQEGIDNLVQGGVWGEQSATIGNLIKKIGKYYISIADREGGEATQEDLNNARTLLSRRLLQRKITSACNNVIGGYELGQISSWEDAVNVFSNTLN